MLIDNGNNTVTAGAADVICILHDVAKNRYHAAFFEEHPMPGPIKSIRDEGMLRLKSKMHHTEGAETLEGAQIHLTELREKIKLDDANVCELPIAWDGSIGIVWLVPNWLKLGRTFTDIGRPTDIDIAS